MQGAAGDQILQRGHDAAVAFKQAFTSETGAYDMQIEAAPFAGGLHERIGNGLLNALNQIIRVHGKRSRLDSREKL